MNPNNLTKIENRVAAAGEALLADLKYAAPVDILTHIGWLSPQAVERWRRGFMDSLEQFVQVDPGKVSEAMAAFHRWARERGLPPSETPYLTKARERRELRFTAAGDPDVERAFRTHYVSPELPERKRTRLAAKAARPELLPVFDPVKEWKCSACGSGVGFLFLERDQPLCLACADLDHLEWLPRGDAALSRRARAYSRLCAVVLRFARARKRYERQGLLVEPAALERAEAECLADQDARARRLPRVQSSFRIPIAPRFARQGA